MKIGIIGAGKIGATAAQQFLRANHEVAIANSRGPETLQSLVDEIGAGIHAATLEEAATFGEVVLVAIPLGKIQSLPKDAFRGKIVMDANNYYPQRDGHIAALDNDETTSSELLAQHLEGTTVVKAFNTIWFEHLKTKGDTTLPLDERHVIFIAGDDDSAKATVSQLIEEIGFVAVETGSLAEGGRRQQPDTAVYGKVLTRPEAKRVLEGESVAS
jgi:predicted dinucleotide-binding enzyme